MKMLMFDTHRYDKMAFEVANEKFGHNLHFAEPRLSEGTAKLASGFTAVCSFVNDQLNSRCLQTLYSCGVRAIILRSAGYNHVDLEEAKRLDIKVMRVPEYSPHAVAEHTVALILALNRKLYKSYNRVRELNFGLDGLVGFDLHGKTVGIVGTGRIGGVFAKIMHGFGCKLLAYDQQADPKLQTDLGLAYVSLPELLNSSDIISLHVPLTPKTRHLIDEKALANMKKGVMLINTSRGALVETKALIKGLKNGAIGYAGLDVYEEEEGIFFQDLSEFVLQDDTLARLLTFPNVLVTSHQAFLTREALSNIATTTLQNLEDFEQGRPLTNVISV